MSSLRWQRFDEDAVREHKNLLQRLRKFHTRSAGRVLHNVKEDGGVVGHLRKVYARNKLSQTKRGNERSLKYGVLGTNYLWLQPDANTPRQAVYKRGLKEFEYSDEYRRYLNNLYVAERQQESDLLTQQQLRMQQLQQNIMKLSSGSSGVFPFGGKGPGRGGGGGVGAGAGGGLFGLNKKPLSNNDGDEDGYNGDDGVQRRKRVLQKKALLVRQALMANQNIVPLRMKNALFRTKTTTSLKKKTRPFLYDSRNDRLKRVKGVLASNIQESILPAQQRRRRDSDDDHDFDDDGDGDGENDFSSKLPNMIETPAMDLLNGTAAVSDMNSLETRTFIQNLSKLVQIRTDENEDLVYGLSTQQRLDEDKDVVEKTQQLSKIRSEQQPVAEGRAGFRTVLEGGIKDLHKSDKFKADNKQGDDDHDDDDDDDDEDPYGDGGASAMPPYTSTYSQQSPTVKRPVPTKSIIREIPKTQSAEQRQWDETNDEEEELKISFEINEELNNSYRQRVYTALVSLGYSTEFANDFSNRITLSGSKEAYLSLSVEEQIEVANAAAVREQQLQRKQELDSLRNEDGRVNLIELRNDNVPEIMKSAIEETDLPSVPTNTEENLKDVELQQRLSLLGAPEVPVNDKTFVKKVKDKLSKEGEKKGYLNSDNMALISERAQEALEETVPKLKIELTKLANKVNRFRSSVTRTDGLLLQDTVDFVSPSTSAIGSVPQISQTGRLDVVEERRSTETLRARSVQMADNTMGENKIDVKNIVRDVITSLQQSSATNSDDFEVMQLIKHPNTGDSGGKLDVKDLRSDTFAQIVGLRDLNELQIAVNDYKAKATESGKVLDAENLSFLPGENRPNMNKVSSRLLATTPDGSLLAATRQRNPTMAARTDSSNGFYDEEQSVDPISFTVPLDTESLQQSSEALENQTAVADCNHLVENADAQMDWVLNEDEPLRELTAAKESTTIAHHLVRHAIEIGYLTKDMFVVPEVIATCFSLQKLILLLLQQRQGSSYFNDHDLTLHNYRHLDRPGQPFLMLESNGNNVGNLFQVARNVFNFKMRVVTREEFFQDLEADELTEFKKFAYHVFSSNEFGIRESAIWLNFRSVRMFRPSVELAYCNHDIQCRLRNFFLILDNYLLAVYANQTNLETQFRGASLAHQAMGARMRVFISVIERFAVEVEEMLAQSPLGLIFTERPTSLSSDLPTSDSIGRTNGIVNQFSYRTAVQRMIALSSSRIGRVYNYEETASADAGSDGQGWRLLFQNSQPNKLGSLDDAPPSKDELMRSYEAGRGEGTHSATRTIVPRYVLDMVTNALVEYKVLMPSTAPMENQFEGFYVAMNNTPLVRQTMKYIGIMYRRGWRRSVTSQQICMTFVRVYAGLYMMTAQVNLLMHDCTLRDTDRHLKNTGAMQMIYRFQKYMQNVCGIFNPMFMLDEHYLTRREQVEQEANAYMEQFVTNVEGMLSVYKQWLGESVLCFQERDLPTQIERRVLFHRVLADGGYYETMERRMSARQNETKGRVQDSREVAIGTEDMVMADAPLSNLFGDQQKFNVEIINETSRPMSDGRALITQPITVDTQQGSVIMDASHPDLISRTVEERLHYFVEYMEKTLNKFVSDITSKSDRAIPLDRVDVTQQTTDPYNAFSPSPNQFTANVSDSKHKAVLEASRRITLPSKHPRVFNRVAVVQPQQINQEIGGEPTPNQIQSLTLPNPSAPPPRQVVLLAPRRLENSQTPVVATNRDIMTVEDEASATLEELPSGLVVPRSDVVPDEVDTFAPITVSKTTNVPEKKLVADIHTVSGLRNMERRAQVGLRINRVNFEDLASLTPDLNDLGKYVQSDLQKKSIRTVNRRHNLHSRLESRPEDIDVERVRNRNEPSKTQERVSVEVVNDMQMQTQNNADLVERLTGESREQRVIRALADRKFNETLEADSNFGLLPDAQFRENLSSTLVSQVNEPVVKAEMKDKQHQLSDLPLVETREFKQVKTIGKIDKTAQKIIREPDRQNFLVVAAETNRRRAKREEKMKAIGRVYNKIRNAANKVDKPSYEKTVVEKHGGRSERNNVQKTTVRIKRRFKGTAEPRFIPGNKQEQVELARVAAKFRKRMERKKRNQLFHLGDDEESKPTRRARSSTL